MLFPTNNKKDRINKSLKPWRQVRYCFGQPEPFMTPDDMEATPLSSASEIGLSDVVRILLAFRVDVIPMHSMAQLCKLKYRRPSGYSGGAIGTSC